MIVSYLLQFHTQDCIDIIRHNDSLGFYSVNVDFMNLFETYPDIGDKVLCSPIQTLPDCDKDIITAQEHLLEKDEYRSQVEKLEFRLVKKNVHARFFGLPVCPELHRTIFPKNVDMGCFLKVIGTVVRVTQAKMLEYNRKYVCVKCKHENMVKADFDNRYVLKAPTKCGNADKKCKSTIFNQVNLVSREYCKDYQEIKIQEQVNKLSIGTIPGSIWVVLEDDLVDACKPGDDVQICGTVRRRWRPSSLNKKCEVDIVLQANYLEVCNAQRSAIVSSAPDIKECFDDYWERFTACPVKGRDLILASVAPQVYGLDLVKLALLLTVITGANHIAESDHKCKQEDDHLTRVRGQCHLLLVGDPGTGKSELLRAASEMTSRSVFTSGAGSTRAGLTCAALREDGEWQLEAGALVLSDGGVCCIDEICHLRERDRTSIHEAMEQQTISIAKAGIVCKLNTRCAVVAACNPKGRYETDQPLSVNVSLGTPLLSRFDLIFILLDTKNNPWDKLVSSYILFGETNSVSNARWSLDKLQMYIALIGPRSTKMTKSANIILQTYYMAQRKSENRDPCRTTVRMLDSLVRLSQAHCRLMYRTTILTMDAVVAVTLIDLSMQDYTLSDTVDALHSTTPKYPDFTYLTKAKKLLSKLNLYEIWQEELFYYAKLLQVDHKSLESDIDKGNNNLFAKYDDVADVNIPLSASLVTSSYFNKDKVEIAMAKSKEEKIDKIVETLDKKVNDKLAATLKKHAALNKEVKSPQKQYKKSVKRKRKEVVLDTSVLIKPKKDRKKKAKIEAKSDSEHSDNNENDMLKAVPSAFDIFGDLDLNMDIEEDYTNTKSDKNDNFEENHESNNLKIKEENISIIEGDGTGNNFEEINKVNENKSDRKQKHKTPSVADRLKQFQFKENKDLNSYYDTSVKPKSYPSEIVNNDSIVIQQSCKTDIEKCSKDRDTNLKATFIHKAHDLNPLPHDGGGRSPNLKAQSSKSVSVNSQASIFETSDYEIDLDRSEIINKIKVEGLVNKKSVTDTKSLGPSSQISIFENSDCDIDFDI